MTRPVDLTKKVIEWSNRLALIEKEAIRLKEKIVFAKEILQEEGGKEEINETILLPVPKISSRDMSLAANIRNLFKTHPDKEFNNEDVFNYLSEQNIPFEKPSVYATLSKWAKDKKIESRKEGNTTYYKFKS